MKKEIKITLTENDIHTAYNKLLVKYAALQKENTELKETVTKMNNVIIGIFSNFTKAKEFLNEFMRISKASDEDFEHDYSELIAEAEAFLNSEVER